MECDRCGDAVSAEEKREHLGKVLCEDCYMDVLSPSRTCDPWSIHSAKRLEDASGGATDLSTLQSDILRILEETGGVEPRDLAERLQMKPSDLEREIASLRHMEKLRGELREGRKFVVLW